MVVVGVVVGVGVVVAVVVGVGVGVVVGVVVGVGVVVAVGVGVGVVVVVAVGMSLSFRESDHTYWNGNRELISVTTLLGATNLAKDLAFLNLDPMYRSRGSAVHQIFELVDKGEYEKEGTSEELWPYAEQIQAFKRDTGFAGRIWEQGFALPAHGVAGTLDCLGMCGEEVWLIDIKTGSLQELGVGCQLAAYEDLAWRGEPIQGPDNDLEWLENIKITAKSVHRKSLNLTGDGGNYTLRSHQEPIWKARWRSALTLYNCWKEFGILKNDNRR